MSPIAFSNGVQIDGHIMMLAYSAAFGGPVTFLITASLSSLYKLAMGLPLSLGSLTTLGVTGTIGLAWHLFVRPKLGLSMQSLLVLGLMSSSQILLFFLLPFDVAVAMIVRTLPVAILIAVIGAVLMGKFIEREMRHIDLEGRLANEANTDALTGLQNRRAFEITVAALDRLPDEATVMAVDIDHFKVFNDTFGHETGDQVLKAVGGCLEQTLARRGQVYRTGGEEFTLVLPGVFGQTAVDVAERIRLDVADLGAPRVPRQVTVSIGIASVGSSTGAMLAIRKADKALYVAKSAGRNRCVHAEDLEESIFGAGVRSAA
jgi:diguanylate cyclase